MNLPILSRGGVLYVLTPADLPIRVTHVSDADKWCGARRHGTVHEIITDTICRVTWDDTGSREFTHPITSLEDCACQ